VRSRDQGVILINVLVILALCATITFAMIRLSDTAITRSQRFSAAGQGLALIAAGEASAIALLRRDDPASDDLTEDWAVAQEPVAIAGGSFALRIEDAQSRLNLNSLPQMGALGLQLLTGIARARDLPEDVPLRIAARMAQGPLVHMGDLQQAGVSAADIAALAPYVAALPRPTEWNINTMPDAMLTVVTTNPVQARQIQGLRARKGRLTPADLATAGVVLPQGLGFTSAFFRVTTEVTIDGVAQRGISLLQRRGSPVAVMVIERGRS
jgi:general secretion pathway protein K